MQTMEKICLTGLLLGPSHGYVTTNIGGKSFADGEEVETKMRMWLTQQSKDFYVAGFHAPVK
jgi:hypothetical protein